MGYRFSGYLVMPLLQDHHPLHHTTPRFLSSIHFIFPIFGATPSNSQILLLVLHSGIITGNVQKPYRIPEIKPELATCKAIPYLMDYLSCPTQFCMAKQITFPMSSNWIQCFLILMPHQTASWYLLTLLFHTKLHISYIVLFSHINFSEVKSKSDSFSHPPHSYNDGDWHIGCV